MHNVQYIRRIDCQPNNEKVISTGDEKQVILGYHNSGAKSIACIPTAALYINVKLDCGLLLSYVYSVIKLR